MDPWYPLGQADMLDVASMGIHAVPMTSREAMGWTFAAVTVNPARVMHLDGYGLAKGDQHNRRRAGDGFSRRLRKIYPSVFIVLAATAIFDFQSLWITRLSDVPFRFIWPPQYPFIMQITTFYVIYFLWSRTPLARWPLALCLGLVPFYIAGGERSSLELRTHVLHWVFYFQVMMLGVVVARYRINEYKISPDLIWAGFFASFFIVYRADFQSAPIIIAASTITYPVILDGIKLIILSEFAANQPMFENMEFLYPIIESKVFIVLYTNAPGNPNNPK